MQKQVAEVAKALYQRTDELVVLRARAITAVVGAGALPQIACTLRSIDVYSAWMTDAYNDCTAAAVQQTVDRTLRGAFNRPI